MSSRLVDLRNIARRKAEGPRSPKRVRDQRPLPLRERRRRTRAVAVGAIALASAMIAYGVHWISYLPQYAIHSIYVTGTTQIDPQVVAQYAQSILYDGTRRFLSRQNMFLYPRAVIERDVVANFPVIKSAHVSRPSFMATQVSISVKERSAYATWCPDLASALDCYVMDESGFVFAQKGTEVPATHYVFSGGLVASSSPVAQRFVPAHLSGIVSLLDQLGQAGLHPQAAMLADGEDFIASFAEGFSLKASYGSDTAALISDLKLILNSDALRDKRDQIEYIDLRFGNKVYYKLKGDAAQTQTE